MKNFPRFFRLLCLFLALLLLTGCSDSSQGGLPVSAIRPTANLQTRFLEWKFSSSDDPSEGDENCLEELFRFLSGSASGNHEAFDRLLQSDRKKLIGHRGMSAFYPENTLPAFTACGQAGFWGIETDIYETTDGHFVCIHDSTVDRTTDGSGGVRSFSLDALRTLKIDAGKNITDYPDLKIPTLEEYLSICRSYGCVAVIEIKEITDYSGVLNILNAYGMTDRCLFLGTFDSLRQVRSLTQEIPFMCLVYEGSNDYASPVEWLKNTSLTNVGLDFQDNPSLLTPQVHLDCQNLGITVGVWTLNDPDLVNAYFSCNIPLVTTDGYPSVRP